MVKLVRIILRNYGIKRRGQQWRATWVWAHTISISYYYPHWPTALEISTQYILLLLAEIKVNDGLKLPHRASTVIPEEVRALLPSNPVPLLIHEPRRLFPFGYFRQSGRGQNGYLKIRYSSIEEFNETAEKLQALLRQLFLQFEIRCDIEVNGKITHKGKSGSLAKLPFKVDVWNGDQLELFKACPVVSIRRVSQIACQIAGLIDENRVVSQPTENTPAGRMQRRVLASMASFYTEQQSLDVREGLARRVQSGLFVSKPHFGSRNIRINGRSIVEIHPEKATVVRRAYELYAYHNHTLGTLSEVLYAEGMSFTIHGFRATI